MTKLYLDDDRDAPDDTWTVVRTSDAFIAHITEHGVPDVISFDYKLGFGDERTGLDCARWLVAQKLPIKEFLVHSSHLTGQEEIPDLLNAWKAKS